MPLSSGFAARSSSSAAAAAASTAGGSAGGVAPALPDGAGSSGGVARVCSGGGVTPRGTKAVVYGAARRLLPSGMEAVTTPVAASQLSVTPGHGEMDRPDAEPSTGAKPSISTDQEPSVRRLMRVPS